MDECIQSVQTPHTLTMKQSQTPASYKCGYSGLFIDLFISALFHGCISGHSEEVVAQSEEKQLEMHQMYEAQTLCFQLFTGTKVTCSKIWLLLDLPLPTAQLEQHCGKQENQSICWGG